MNNPVNSDDGHRSDTNRVKLLDDVAPVDGTAHKSPADRAEQQKIFLHLVHGSLRPDNRAAHAPSSAPVGHEIRVAQPLEAVTNRRCPFELEVGRGRAHLALEPADRRVEFRGRPILIALVRHLRARSDNLARTRSKGRRQCA